MALVTDLHFLDFEVVHVVVLLVLLDTFTKLRIIIFIMSVCLSVRPHGTTPLRLGEFSLK